MNASPGAAVGKVVFDSYTAVKWSRSGEKVILVRRETNPDDLNGMIAAAGHPDQPGRQDQPRRGGGPRDGQDLRVRRRAARGRHQGPALQHPGRQDLSKRAPSSRSTAPPARCSSARCRWSPRRWSATSRARSTPRSDEADDLVRAVHRIMRVADGGRPDGGAGQRRHRRRRRPGPPLRRAGHRAVPHRAHVPGRPPVAGRGADPGRHRRPSASGSWPSCCRCSARTSRASSRRWTACR